MSNDEPISRTQAKQNLRLVLELDMHRTARVGENQMFDRVWYQCREATKSNNANKTETELNEWHQSFNDHFVRYESAYY